MGLAASMLLGRAHGSRTHLGYAGEGARQRRARVEVHSVVVEKEVGDLPVHVVRPRMFQPLLRTQGHDHRLRSHAQERQAQAAALAGLLTPPLVHNLVASAAVQRRRRLMTHNAPRALAFAHG